MNLMLLRCCKADSQVRKVFVIMVKQYTMVHVIYEYVPSFPKTITCVISPSQSYAVYQTKSQFRYLNRHRLPNNFSSQHISIDTGYQTYDQNLSSTWFGSPCMGWDENSGVGRPTKHTLSVPKKKEHTLLYLVSTVSSAKSSMLKPGYSYLDCSS